MTRLAIIKPDHVGDLVLSSPAIRACARYFSDVVLYVAPWNLDLAAYLFPGIDVRSILFGHLSKHQHRNSEVPDLSAYDHVLVLRDDRQVVGHPMVRSCTSLVLNDDCSNLVHQSRRDLGAARKLGLDYEPAAFFGIPGLRGQSVGNQISTVGLCIGSGFSANRWPLYCWIGLASLLREGGRRVKFILGPSELPYRRLLHGLSAGDDGFIVADAGDVHSFLEQVSALDAVVATDGGSGHLCSLVADVVSLFGPSPYRRYAPFGDNSYVITRALECAPCPQYMSAAINGCTSRECMLLLTPEAIHQALLTVWAGQFRVGVTSTAAGLLIVRGASSVFRHAAHG
jgi:heptosyltransferase-2